jgi:hypothetical protein
MIHLDGEYEGITLCGLDKPQPLTVDATIATCADCLEMHALLTPA